MDGYVVFARTPELRSAQPPIPDGACRSVRKLRDMDPRVRSRLVARANSGHIKMGVVCSSHVRLFPLGGCCVGWVRRNQYLRDLGTGGGGLQFCHALFGNLRGTFRQGAAWHWTRVRNRANKFSHACSYRFTVPRRSKNPCKFVTIRCYDHRCRGLFSPRLYFGKSANATLEIGEP